MEMSACARDRPVGEMKMDVVVVQRFAKRCGFAWRHFSRDAPSLAGSCRDAMMVLMGRVGGCQGKRSLDGLSVASEMGTWGAPPGLEHEAPEIDTASNVPSLEGVAADKLNSREAALERMVTEAVDQMRRDSLATEERWAKTAEEAALKHNNEILELRKALEAYQVQISEPIRAASESGTQTCLEHSCDHPPSFDPQPRKLRAHVSDESTCAWGSVREEEEEIEKAEDGASSMASTEDWEPRLNRSHSRRPRRDRRRKARAKRELWDEAKAQSSREASFDANRDLVGALLTCIDEDGLCADSYGTSCKASDDSDDSHDYTAQLGANGPMADDGRESCSTPDPQDKSGDERPHAKRARIKSELGVECQDEKLGEHDGSSRESSWSADEGGGDVDLTENERLEDLEKGAAALPAYLVHSLIQVQEAADKWQADEETGEASVSKEEFTLGLKGVRHRLKRVKSVMRHLNTSWECPQFMRRQWRKLQEWLLEEEAGVCYHMQKIDELMEDAADKKEEDGEADEEWMGFELCYRCSSIRDSWEQVVEHIEAIEKAIARRDYLEQRRADEDADTQAAINSRLAMSLERRRLSGC